jgi:hypothetical protein
MKTSRHSLTGLVILISVLTSCSGTDIGSDQDVLGDIQGTWVGYEYTGNMYMYIKVHITDNTFDGWLQTSDTENEPEWTALPNEKGTFSLSSVQVYPDAAGKFRKLNFVILHRCCGDNSLTARSLSRIITYEEGKGLCVAGKSAISL